MDIGIEEERKEKRRVRKRMKIKERLKDAFTEDVIDEIEDDLEAQKDPTEPKYIFPNFLAKLMSKVDQKAQYEASMMSIVFILFGVTWFVIYNAFMSPSTIAVRVVGVINLVAVFVLLSSNLVTQFQQYQTYCKAMQTFKDFQKLKEGVKK
jgi:hypothetical protein